MGDGVILESKTVTPIECLHYAMNLPTSVVITGIDSMEILEQALEAAPHLPAAERERGAALLARTTTAAAEGRVRAVQDHSTSTAPHPIPTGSARSLSTFSRPRRPSGFDGSLPWMMPSVPSDRCPPISDLP